MRLEVWKKLSRDLIPESYRAKLEAYDDKLFIVFNEHKNYFEVFQFLKEDVKPFTVTCCEVLDDRLFKYLDEHRVERNNKIMSEIRLADEKREADFQKEAKNIDMEIKKLHKTTVEQQHFPVKQGEK